MYLYFRLSVTIETRQLYAVGTGLGLIGSLVAVASLILAGSVAIAALALPTPFTFAIVLVNVFRREDFDRDHSLGYRIVNVCGAVFTVVLGLFVLAVGVWSFGVFG